jgi:hypothetical protein
MRPLALGVLLAAWLAHPALASAEAWYFDWNCAGACAPNQLAISGVEGPYASEGSCDSARRAKLDWVLAPGSAGWASACTEGNAASVPGGASGGVTQAAHLAGATLGVISSDGYRATYADGTRARGPRDYGAELELGFGREQFGLAVVIGLDHDAGTATATLPAEPLWLLELGVGLQTSPFAALRTRTLELRPSLGAYGFNVIRVACGRCDVDPLASQPGEANNAFGTRLRAGVELYLGASRAQGIAIDALFSFHKIGDFTDPTEPTSVELTPARFMLRVSWIPFRDQTR